MTWRIEHGDCRAVMAAMEAESVDAIVTDPPYGLSFMGKGWDHGTPGLEFWTAALRVAKPGAHLLAFGGTRTFHRLTCAIEDAGWEIRDCLMFLQGQGFPKSRNIGCKCRGPASAQESGGTCPACGGLIDWQGWGTALKPAWEPIIMARKPFRGTVAANVQATGCGAINVDGCRIVGPKPDTTRGAGGQNGRYGPLGAQGRITDDGAGRWPANVVLDEEAARMLDEQSGTLQSGLMVAGTQRSQGGGYHGNFPGEATAHDTPGDSGGASRFFYTAKASRSEREIGGPCNHPCVKPLDLMCWLVRLVTPPGGLVLDPFAGSGTTVIAALRQGFRAIGIEQEADYVALARARIAADAPLLNGGHLAP